MPLFKDALHLPVIEDHPNIRTVSVQSTPSSLASSRFGGWHRSWAGIPGCSPWHIAFCWRPPGEWLPEICISDLDQRL